MRTLKTIAAVSVAGTIAFSASVPAHSATLSSLPAMAKPAENTVQIRWGGGWGGGGWRGGWGGWRGGGGWGGWRGGGWGWGLGAGLLTGALVGGALAAAPYYGDFGPYDS